MEGKIPKNRFCQVSRLGARNKGIPTKQKEETRSSAKNEEQSGKF